MDNTVNSNIKGLVIVPTGKLNNFTRKGIRTLIECLGGKCRSYVSIRTDYVLVGKKPDTSTQGQSLSVFPQLLRTNF